MTTERLPAFGPRWLYRFFSFWDSLPIPGWLAGAAVALAFAVVFHLAAWQQGALPPGQLDNYLSILGLVLVVIPATWGFFTRRGHQALIQFFQNTKSRAQIEKIAADFNSLPSAVLFLVLGVLWGYADYFFIFKTQIPLSALVLPQLSLITWLAIHALGTLLLGRTLRQLGLMRRFYGEIKVNLFDPLPIYALSRYGSTTTIVFLLLTYTVGLLAVSHFFTSPIGYFFQAIGVVTALLMFFVPLMGTNQRMRQAKARLLAQLGKDIEVVYLLVHSAVQKREFAKLARIQTGVMSLKNEQEIIQRIPTWPWQPGTLLNLLTPMLIPVIVYLIQRFFGAMFGL
jgi:hypothetical protein